MSRTTEAKTRTIKMRLLREGEAFSVDNAMKDGHRLREVPWEGGIEGSRVFVGSVYTNPPPWLEFISSLVVDPPQMMNSGCAAVLFVPVNDRTLVISFGHAHLVMNAEKFERNFGLKVTLNMVARGRLRSMDAATLDATTIQRRVQASRNSDLALFGIDYDRDLVSQAAGVPSDGTFAKFLAGSDSLSITCELTFEGIYEKCRQAMEAFKADAYQTHYKWIDHVQPVRESNLIESLDQALYDALTELRAGSENDLHMAPPEIVNYMEGTELRYNGLGERGEIYQQLAIEDYVAELERSMFTGDISDIKTSHMVSAKNRDTEKFSEKWKLYNCFVYETAQNNKKYVIFGGQWYCVDIDFGLEVERFFVGIRRVTVIEHTHHMNEELLIADLELNRCDLLKLDCVLISAAGLSYDRIEACDFLSQDKQFVHLKDGHSSSPISHLLMQGIVSAEAFGSNREFRKRLRKEVSKRNTAFERLIPDGRTHNIDRSKYTVVYGIMRKLNRNGELDIPFFSKVSLRSAVQRLEMLGFPVALNLIEKRV